MGWLGRIKKESVPQKAMLAKFKYFGQLNYFTTCIIAKFFHFLKSGL